jgi:integrase
MDDQNRLSTSPSKREPSNKGKFTGAKPPLRPKHVWSIRSKLEADGRKRDLAMFNLAIDSKLRACDVVTLKVEDIAPKRICGRSGHHTPEEDGATCSV